MTPKRIVIVGPNTETTEEGLRAWLGRFGQVKRVKIVRDDDNAKDSLALAEMSMDNGAAAYLASCLNNSLHKGRLDNTQRLQD